MAGRRVEFDIIANDHASRTLGNVGDSADHAGGRLGKLGGVAKTAGLALGGALVGGVAAFGVALAQGVKDAASYQDLAAKSAAVLKSTGNAANTSVDKIQALAGSLESLSGVDEELIINSQNVLATFTNVTNAAGKGNDIFDQATKAALDMSTALGTDLQGSTIQLGKALNDPIKGITALSRVGVSFTEDQKSQIKAMVQAGDTMGAQKLILKELNKEFGGAAKAVGQGFNGSLARLKDTLGDTMRNLGEKLLPALTDVTNWMNDRLPKAIAWVSDKFSLLWSGMTMSSDVAAEFGDDLEGLVKVGAGLRRGWDGLTKAVKFLWDGGKKLSGWVTGELIPSVRHTVEKYLPMFQFALDQVRAAFKSSGDKGTDWMGIVRRIGDVVKVAFDIMVFAIGAFAVSIGVAFRAFKAAWDNVLWPVLKFMAKSFVDNLGIIVDAAANALGWIPGIGSKLKKAQASFRQFRDSVNASLAGIRDQTVSIRIANRVGPGVKNMNGRNLRSDLPSGAAVGGYRPAGWMGMVGETGPELVQFPSGGTVMTAGQTARAMSGQSAGSGGSTLIVNVYPRALLGSKREVLAWIDEAVAQSKRNRTYVTPQIAR